MINAQFLTKLHRNLRTPLQDMLGTCDFCKIPNSSMGILELKLASDLDPGIELNFIFEFCQNCYDAIKEKDVVINYCLSCFNYSFVKTLGVGKDPLKKFAWDLTCKKCNAVTNTEGIFCYTPKIYLFKDLDSSFDYLDRLKDNPKGKYAYTGEVPKFKKSEKQGYFLKNNEVDSNVPKKCNEQWENRFWCPKRHQLIKKHCPFLSLHECESFKRQCNSL